MGWIARAFGRAVIYNTVREGFYEARHQRRTVTPRHTTVTPVERLQAMNKQALVQYECQQGHRFVVPFYEEGRPNERDLAGQQCSQCRAPCRWLSIDFHIENDQ